MCAIAWMSPWFPTSKTDKWYCSITYWGVSRQGSRVSRSAGVRVRADDREDLGELSRNEEVVVEMDVIRFALDIDEALRFDDLTMVHAAEVGHYSKDSIRPPRRLRTQVRCLLQ